MSTQSDTGQKLTFATVGLDPSGEMAVTWDLSNPLPDTGAALVSLVATSADHKSRKQLGYKVVDGSKSAYFVFDYDAAFQTELPGSPDLSDPRRVKGVMPARFTGSLGEGWTWWAALNIDGKDVDIIRSGDSRR